MAARSTAILFTRSGLGNAPEDLGIKVTRTFLTVLADSGQATALLFYTEGVKLVAESSPVLEELRALERAGTKVLSCGTCVDYFGLRDKVRVGIIAGMPAILDAMSSAAKVITV